MVNPFKRTYQIIEYKNLDGKVRYTVIYASLLERLFSFIGFNIFVEASGDLYWKQWASSFLTIEFAQKAVENHKNKVEQDKRQEYKKSAIHYVE